MSELERNQSAGADSGTPGEWERNVLSRLVFATLAEQRRARRWNIFFKSLIFLFLFMSLLVYLPDSKRGIETGEHTALVEINGVIADATEANADNIIGGLRDAFEDKNTAGIILRINSPGGSPVQSGYVHDEINRLRGKYPEIPVYAVVVDICASGGYYIASAADKIFADKASLVGSIGVVMNGFGFVGALDKLGIERRLITAGKHKGFLDPFSPAKEEETKHVKTILDNIHKQFIEVVKKGRGERLSHDADLFSGYIWTGEQGLALGLVDGLGSSGTVARDEIGAERIVDFTRKPDYLDRFAKRLGSAMANAFVSILGESGSIK